MGINGAMFIQTEQTPNPQTLKYLPGRAVMKEGTAFFQNMGESADSPLAKRLFILDGVKGVFLEVILLQLQNLKI